MTRMMSKRPLPGAFVVPPSVVLGPRTRIEGSFSDDSVTLLYSDDDAYISIILSFLALSLSEEFI